MKNRPQARCTRKRRDIKFHRATGRDSKMVQKNSGNVSSTKIAPPGIVNTMEEEQDYCL